MNNKACANAYMKDARIIFEEGKESFTKGHWHRVVRKCQEAVELTIKGYFRYLGIEYPKSHILGRIIRKELSRFIKKEDIEKLSFIADSLTFDRGPAFYGTPDGISAAELFTKEDAEEAMEKAKWVIEGLKEKMK